MYCRLAEECGEIIWQRGFLTKGISLCHGSLGNAIFFLQLFRLTRKKIWFTRAVTYAWYIVQPENQMLWKQAD